MMSQSKFRHNERRHDVIQEFESLSGSTVIDVKQLNDRPSSLILGGSIRAQFDPKYGGSSDLRGIKIVGHQEYCNDVVHRGKMYIPAKEPKNHEFTPSVKQFHGAKDLPSEPLTSLSKDWKTKARLSSSESGMHDIDGIMGRKQRTSSSEQQRNDIPYVSQGDKYYKEVDRERHFFKNGGLIPGSCIALRKTVKPDIRLKDDSKQANSNLKPTLTYKEKKVKELLDNELKQLRELNNASERLGQGVPSWEQKTGFYLVTPEDENF